ncbi:MAG: hypothetical protein IKO00_10545 [Oscillospiraceae bacterium]|nr:hypothetical protein [Oscillospiraceae bacterium]
MQENDALHIQLRKNQDTLKIVGLGVMAFGAWSIVRTILYTTLQWNSIIENMVEQELSAKTAGIMYIIVSVMIMAVEIAIRLYIGRSAIAEGKGERKRSGYIVVAFLIALLNLSLMFSFFMLLGTRTEISLDALVTMFVELTSTVILLEMCQSAIRVRKLRRQIAEQG